MSESDKYFDHLMFICEIGSLRRPYLRVCREMYRREFYAANAFDSDRIACAESRREEWAREFNETTSGLPPVSVLEVLIDIAIGMADQMGRPGVPDDPGEWLIEMFENMGLTDYEDCVFSDSGGRKSVSDACEKLLTCSYDADGSGGPFPQNVTLFDSRELDLWSQACRYLAEKYEIW